MKSKNRRLWWLRIILKWSSTLLLAYALLIMPCNMLLMPQELQANKGAYNLKWTAADPDINRGPYAPTYPKLTPAQLPPPAAGLSGGGGRLNGAAVLPDAVFYGPTYSSGNIDAVTSLSPDNMLLGQIVPFELEIKVNGSVSPENGVINFTLNWLAKTTSGGDFGFSTAYKVYAAFVDISDAGHVDPLQNARVDSFSSSIQNAGTQNELIKGVFQVSGLDNGDNIIVEIWMVLKNTIAEGVTGNVQTALIKATTGPISCPQSTISTGNQTVPLLQVGSFINHIAVPSIGITKVTADGGSSGDGLNILSGETLAWRYTVRNIGNVPLSNVVVTDSENGITPVYISGDGNLNSLLDLSEIWVFEAGGTAVAGDYTNTGTAAGSYNGTNVSAADFSYYWGADPQIILNKVTVNGDDVGDDLTIPAGTAVIWRYMVSNAGNVPLSNIVVTDSESGVTPVYISGDGNLNSLLDLSETWVFEAGGTAVDGSYTNTGTVSGIYVDSAGHSRTDTETDSSSYFGTITAHPAIDIEKYINGEDADSAPGVSLPGGSPVTFIYQVTGTGDVALSNISVRDDNGTPNYSGDDFSPAMIDISPADGYNDGDTNTNNILDPGETWGYIASGTAVTGLYTNIAAAAGQYNGDTFTDSDPANYTGSGGPPQPPVVPGMTFWGLIMAASAMGLIMAQLLSKKKA